MLRYLLSGNISIWGVLFMLCGYAVLVLLLLPVHEFAHAYTAYRLGDTTPRYYGRLTLNPKAHLDPIGALMLVLCGVGYAKPVPVNPAYFRNPKRGMVITALAGPLSNLLMAAAALGIFRVILFFSVSYTAFLEYSYLFLVEVVAGVNISLAVFNLLPIPPLDGSRIFEPLFPAKWRYSISRYQQYITTAVMVLILTGALDVPLDFLHRVVGGALCTVFGMPNLFG